MKTQSLKRQNLSLLFLAICFMLTTGMKCKKDNNLLDEYGLPKPTQGGLGRFACQVNDENWIANKSYSYRVGGEIKKDSLKFWGRRSDSHFESFAIYIYKTEVKENTVYRLNNQSNMFGSYFSDKDCFFNVVPYDYGEAKSTDGEVIFTKIRKIDAYTTIISGTFWLDIPTDKCGELKIKHGRFDINIATGNVK